MTSLGFACRCGSLAGTIFDVSPAEVNHVACHCRDCRSAYTFLGMPDPRRVEIVQTCQDKIRIDDGAVHLQVFRHTARGALRWYASCCDTPLFLTPLKARLVHVGVNADRLSDPAHAGKVTAELFIPLADGKTRNRGMLRAISRLISRIAARNLNGEWRKSPFFDEDGRPVRTPRILPPEERLGALADLRT